MKGLQANIQHHLLQSLSLLRLLMLNYAVMLESYVNIQTILIGIGLLASLTLESLYLLFIQLRSFPPPQSSTFRKPIQLPKLILYPLQFPLKILALLLEQLHLNPANFRNQIAFPKPIIVVDVGIVGLGVLGEDIEMLAVVVFGSNLQFLYAFEYFCFYFGDLIVEDGLLFLGGLFLFDGVSGHLLLIKCI